METNEEYIAAFLSSPPRLPRQLPQEVINFNKAIADANIAHQRRHDLYHGITKLSDWGLGPGDVDLG
jgi:hypothetical protein